MKVKEKVKTFVKEHKTDFLIGGAAIAAGTFLGWNGYKHIKIGKGKCISQIPSVSHVLMDCDEFYDTNVKGMFTATPKGMEPIAIKDLGKLGEKIMEFGAKDDTTKITHFIMFGEPMKLD